MDALILVGCEKYSEPIKELEGPAHDVELVKNEFIKNCYINPDLIFQIDDKAIESKKNNIIDFIDEAVLKCNSIGVDNVFFYFSGHGFIDEGTQRLFLMPSDVKGGWLTATSIEYNFLVNRIKSIRARKANFIFFIDACQTELYQKKGELDIESALPNDVATFCSCLPGTNSYIVPEKQTSLFTLGLSEGLGKCKTMGELDVFLKDRVLQLCSENNMGQQIPYTHFNNSSVLSISLANKRLADTNEKVVFTESEIKQVETFWKLIDVKDRTVIYHYGEAAIKKYDSFLEKFSSYILKDEASILDEIRKFSMVVNDSNPNSNTGLLDKLFKRARLGYIGNLINAIEQIKSDKTLVIIIRLWSTLEKANEQLAVNQKEATMYIVAAEKAIAHSPNNETDEQKLFERRLERLAELLEMQEQERTKVINHISILEKLQDELTDFDGKIAKWILRLKELNDMKLSGTQSVPEYMEVLTHVQSFSRDLTVISERLMM